jgi:putative iron-regulated protein
LADYQPAITVQERTMRTPLLALICTCLCLLACQDPTPSEPAPSPTVRPKAEVPMLLGDATEQLWLTGEALLGASHEQLLGLRLAVQALLKTPSGAALTHARDQWHRAHDSLQAFSLFFAMAEAHPGLLVPLNSLHDRLDGWPIQPGFLDYFDVYSHSGLVNDIAIPVTAEALREAHQQFDQQDRALGLHPVAYLLWGDQGLRPADDYQPQQPQHQAEDAPKPVDLPRNRRRALLALMVELSIDDLDKLRAQWRASGALNQTFMQFNAQQRAEILRASSLYLIEKILIKQQLQKQLNAISLPDSEFEGHNAYSSPGSDPLGAQLASLKLLAHDSAPARQLLDHWTQGASASWRDQLLATERLLAKLPPAGEVTETQLVAAIAALQQLALPLKPAPEAP